MMITILYQIISVVFLGSFLFAAVHVLRGTDNRRKNQIFIWKVSCERIGRARKRRIRFLRADGCDSVSLVPGVYRIGNTFECELYVDVTSINSLKLLANVQTDCIRLTVLKGKVEINHKQYEENPEIQIKLSEYVPIFAGDIKLIFRRIKK